jgi:hypothetical protein
MRHSGIVFLITAIISFAVLLVYGYQDQTYATQTCVMEDSGGQKCGPRIVNIVSRYNEVVLFVEDCGDLCDNLIVGFSKNNDTALQEIKYINNNNKQISIPIELKISALDTNTDYHIVVKCADVEKCSGYGHKYKVTTSNCEMTYDVQTGSAKSVDCTRSFDTTPAPTNLRYGDKNDSLLFIHKIFEYLSENMSLVLLTCITILFICAYFIYHRPKKHTFKTRLRSLYRERKKK